MNNHLLNEAATIHWHGLHQRGTWYMDGVSGLQQCAIIPESSFSVSFDMEPAGTYFYHAHHKTISAHGLHGPLIIEKGTLLIAVQCGCQFPIAPWKLQMVSHFCQGNGDGVCFTSCIKSIIRHPRAKITAKVSECTAVVAVNRSSTFAKTKPFSFFPLENFMFQSKSNIHNGPPNMCLRGRISLHISSSTSKSPT